MIFIAAGNEPTMVLMLTEQDCNDMRAGRTKFVNKTATKGHLFDQVVISLHKNQAEIEETLRAAGHGALLKNMPSPEPQPGDVVCASCQSILKAYLILDGKCIACWREIALRQTRTQERLQSES